MGNAWRLDLIAFARGTSDGITFRHARCDKIVSKIVTFLRESFMKRKRNDVFLKWNLGNSWHFSEVKGTLVER